MCLMCLMCACVQTVEQANTSAGTNFTHCQTEEREKKYYKIISATEMESKTKANFPFISLEAIVHICWWWWWLLLPPSMSTRRGSSSRLHAILFVSELGVCM